LNTVLTSENLKPPGTQEKKRLEAAILEADTKAGALRASLDGQWGQLKELKNQACLFLLANI
jgi:hypothetical protein